MVFIGGGRFRRRGYGQYGGGYGPGYGRRYGGGSSCLRDLFLLEGGCCIAELLGCGPGLLFVAPSLVRRSVKAGSVGSGGIVGGEVRSRWTQALVAAIEVYQGNISPKRRACCRFTPTCSHYAREALQRYGWRRGLSLTARRLGRCRPGATRRSDPVPIT